MPVSVSPVTEPEENIPQKPTQPPQTAISEVKMIEQTDPFRSGVAIQQAKSPHNPTTTQETSEISTVTTEPVVIPEIPPKPAETKEQHFIEALRIAVAEKFDPICIYTQCYHETDGFRRLVGNWNYCGCKPPQKAIPPVPIKPIEIWTHEVIDGVNTKLKDTFADFNSADDFMIFYCWQIGRLYKMTYENRNNPRMYFYGLTQDINKWATNTSYSEKLEKLYRHLMASGITEKIFEKIS